ncbi:hypothetical protein C8Q80DRAFT_957870 [Daedaleopsis nitida]|nr:hypothetical protein C8Q80DRAFT_957870 [Daedaleopsis nitida]
MYAGIVYELARKTMSSRSRDRVCMATVMWTQTHCGPQLLVYWPLQLCFELICTVPVIERTMGGQSAQRKRVLGRRGDSLRNRKSGTRQLQVFSLSPSIMSRHHLVQETPDVYAEQLLPRGFGLPLWAPYDIGTRRPIFVGQVGFLERNGFYAAFNTLDNTPVSQGIVPLRADEAHIQTLNEIVASPVVGYATQRMPMRFHDNGSMLRMAHINLEANASDAALFLDLPAVSEFIYSKAHLVRYLKRHFQTWFQRTERDMGQDSRDTLVFISGTVKTSGFSAFACSSIRAGANVEVSVEKPSMRITPKVDNLPLNAGSYTYHVSDSSTKDQTVFVHFYKMKKRLFNSMPMRAAAGHHQLPRGGGGGASSGSRGVDPRSYNGKSIDAAGVGRRCPLVDDLIDYILNKSHAEVAIASTHDVQTLFNPTYCAHAAQIAGHHWREGNATNNLAMILNDLNPGIEVDSHGVGTLRLPDHSKTAAQPGNAYAHASAHGSMGHGVMHVGGHQGHGQSGAAHAMHAGGAHAAYGGQHASYGVNYAHGGQHASGGQHAYGSGHPAMHPRGPFCKCTRAGSCVL